MKNRTRAGLQVAVASEKGLRDENQDWLSWKQVPSGELFIVADGMGGYNGGMRAAKMTVDGVEKCVAEAPPEWSFPRALQEAVSWTNAEVHRAAHSGDPETENMGSTVVVALVTDGKVQVGHVGDSRAYLYRRRKLHQLTRDHTRVQQMLDAGMLTPEQARTHPEGHMLSRAVGSRPDVEVEVGSPVPLEEGDALLLCSDGLTGYVTDEQICAALKAQRDVQRVPTALVNLALSAGGSDNVTVQFVRVGKQARRLASTSLNGGRVTAKLPALMALRASGGAARMAKKAAVWASGPVIAALVVGAFLSALRPQVTITHKPADGASVVLTWNAKRAETVCISPPVDKSCKTSGAVSVAIPSDRAVTYTAKATTRMFGLWPDSVEERTTVVPSSLTNRGTDVATPPRTAVAAGGGTVTRGQEPRRTTEAKVGARTGQEKPAQRTSRSTGPEKPTRSTSRPTGPERPAQPTPRPTPPDKPTQPISGPTPPEGPAQAVSRSAAPDAEPDTPQPPAADTPAPAADVQPPPKPAADPPEAKVGADAPAPESKRDDQNERPTGDTEKKEPQK